MKLQVKIRQACLSQGITTAYQLQTKAGIAPSSASRLFKNNVTQFTLETLDKLCEALDCEPSDLLVRPKRKAKVERGE